MIHILMYNLTFFIVTLSVSIPNDSAESKSCLLMFFCFINLTIGHLLQEVCYLDNIALLLLFNCIVSLIEPRPSNVKDETLEICMNVSGPHNVWRVS